MRPESACKSAAQDVTHTTPDLLRNSAHFRGLLRRAAHENRT
jgi:hypothetical protein